MASTGEHGSAAVDSTQLIRTFRDQMHALGALWILQALFIGGLLAFAGTSLDLSAAMREGGILMVVQLLILVVTGVLLLILGVLTCLKKMWAVRVGLVLSYLALVSNILSFRILPVVIGVIVILQAHRVLKMARELTAAGLPLTTKPQ